MADTSDILSRAPFNLGPEDIAWVEKTLAGLSTADRIGQLMVYATFGDSADFVRSIMATRPGGIHRFMAPDLAAGLAATRIALEESEIPPLVSGDLEGGPMSFPFMMPVPNQMALAACDDPALTGRVAGMLATEARLLGFNWSFTPVIDINARHYSAAVGTRSFGAEVDKVEANAVAYVRALQAGGVAASVKHWPGDGYDDRDQHLLTSVNPLSFEDWGLLSGRIYRSTIDAGVLTVMAAHIALPSWQRKMGGTDNDRWVFEPASLSHRLTTDLLRGHLGFNGLVVSDATPMAGMTGWVNRATAVPLAIASGCDVFLFPESSDAKRMEDGLRDGRLTEARLEEACLRILGLKAALGLHRKPVSERIATLEEAREALATAGHVATSEEVARRSVTLVKRQEGLLPIDAIRYPRVVVIADYPEMILPTMPRRSYEPFFGVLREAGFAVREFDAAALPTPDDTDLVIYLVGGEATIGSTGHGLNWGRLHGGGFRGAMVRFWVEIPTVMVSFGQPYVLHDAPQVGTYVNAYTVLPPWQRAVARKLLGQEPWEGVSPVDPFCGDPSARFSAPLPVKR
jgi:beta-N-acetylhexosaminidase